jgi:hypothetical protein
MVLFLFLNYSLLLCSFSGTPLPSRQGQPVLIQARDTQSAARRSLAPVSIQARDTQSAARIQIAAVSALYKLQL